MTDRCAIFWGSHGCDLEKGHDPPHICGTTDPAGVCSEFKQTGEMFHDKWGAKYPGEVRYNFADLPEPPEWSEWAESEGFSSD